MVFSFTGVFVWSRLQKLSSTSIEIFPQNRKYIVSIAMIVKSYDAKRNRKKTADFKRCAENGLGNTAFFCFVQFAERTL